MSTYGDGGAGDRESQEQRRVHDTHSGASDEDLDQGLDEDEEVEEETEDDASMASPRAIRRSSMADVDEDEDDALESTVYQLAEDIVTTEWADEELTAKLNMIAEALEDAETAFRKDRTPPYRREGNLIGSLLQVLEQHEEFYPTLESKLGELTDSRVKAAVCRVLLATVPVNSRFIVRLLSEEETLDRVCEYAADGEPPLRCYATGLLAVGLRDRSIADIVVNKDAAVQFLKRAKLYASKLQRERQQATKYIQEHLKSASATSRGRRAMSISGPSSTGSRAVSGNTPGSTTTVRSSSIGTKRKFSDITTVPDESTSTEVDSGVSAPSVEDRSVDVSMVDVEAPLQNHSGPSQEEDHLASSAGEDIMGFAPDPERHEEDLKRLVMLELLHTLDCIGLMGEYMELFAPALKEDIIGTIITFLHNKNPTILSHVMKVASHFLAHKKFSFSLIDAGGIELIFTVAKMHQGSGHIGVLDRSLSMCLHGLASSTAVMEKVLAMDAQSLLEVSFSLLSSPNDRARQNAVVFFGLSLSFKAILDFFEKENGLYSLLNIIRAGNNPKSAVQRQLSHDACLCLRQYLRVHMALVTHRLRRRLSQASYHPSHRSTTGTPLLSKASALARLPVRVPKLQATKALDIDDKAHEHNLAFYEKYQFSVPSVNGTPWSAAGGPSGAMWPPAAKLSHLRGPLVMLEVVAMVATLIQNGDPDDGSNTVRAWIVERAQFCLECLRVLTLVVPSLSNEVCSTEVVMDESGSQRRVGMSILLEISTSSNARDSDLIRDSLHVLCNCVSPPHSEDCWQHPHKDIRQFTLTARDMRMPPSSSQGLGHAGTAQLGTDEDPVQLCCSRVRDDKVLRPVRKLAREKNAIKDCVQLLRYKRSVHNADAIRFLATRVLLGLSRDRHVAQILEKMQIGQLLSDLIRQDPILEENADLHVRFRESALDLISIVTHRAPNAVINEATDPTVRKIEKASIVAQTPITYDDQELLRLVHDHLLSKGLTESAATLLREARAQLTTTSRTEAPTSISQELQAQAVEPRINAEEATSSHRPAKLPRLILPASTARKEAAGDESMAIAMAQGSEYRPSKILKLAHGERKKRLRAAFQTSHLFQHRSNLVSEASLERPSQPRPQAARVPPTSEQQTRRAKTSRLDGIITHYLREQHRQCANPVTTVPPFKLLGPDAVHRCPDPSALTKVSMNICARIAERSRSSFRTCAFSSPHADSGVSRFVFSRYRPYRVIGNHSSSSWGTSVARFYGENETEILMGDHSGRLRLVEIETDQIVEEWEVHSGSSAVMDIETNAATRMGAANRLLLTGAQSVSDHSYPDIAVWDMKSMDSPRWSFDGVYSPRFNHFGDRIVALDSRWDGDLQSDEDMSGALMLDIATGFILCELKDQVQSNEYKRDTNCCFAYDDSTVLTGGMLWDARIPTRAVYKFDKLSNSGNGHFHPNGNEVIINSAVWDLRTYQLLRMVPALDKCVVRFNSTGNVMFAYSPHSVIQHTERRVPRAKTWFRVLDTRDYKDICTVELQRPIYDLAINSNSTALSVVEGKYLDASSSVEDDPVCRLYEIGRKRPSEDDSDVEDGMAGSDTMDDDEFDDESESEEDEEEDEEDEDADISDDEEEEEEDDDDDDEDDGVDYIFDDGEEEEMDEGDESELDHDEGMDTGRRVFLDRGRDRQPLSVRMLLELPSDGYYDLHDNSSGDEEGDD